MQIAKWGNSLAVRIPATVVREMGLKEGDFVHLVRTDSKTLAILDRAGMDAYLDSLSLDLPPEWKFNRQELYEQEAGTAGEAAA